MLIYLLTFHKHFNYNINVINTFREIDLTKKKELKKSKIGTQNRKKNTKEPKRMELVYLQQSPNYCEKDHLLGSLGKNILYKYLF